MEINRMGQVTGTQNTWERRVVRGGTKEHGDVARLGKAGIPSKNSYRIGPFTSPEKLLISYEINSHNGAIRAKLIDPESGRIIREIEVKPDIPMIPSKGLLVESIG